MANPRANHCHLVAVLLVFLLLTSSSSARPLNLAFTCDRVVPPEDKEPARHVSTCRSHVAGKLPLSGTRLAGGKYGPLVLNMLPKGPVPPRGPIKGIHGRNN